MRPFLLLVALCLQGVRPTMGQANSVLKIAFGSCSNQKLGTQLWSEIKTQQPDVWMWIGDNVYTDTHNMDTMRRDYDQQKVHPDYQALIKSTKVIGTWDDHDYGADDGGKFYGKKKESKAELMRFLDVPPTSEVFQHEGVYQSYVYGVGKQRVKIILLDTRYFRDTLMKSSDPAKRYELNATGDVLGEAQWRWLENELKNSKAGVHIIASSIQFLANDHGFEKWGNFPQARNRMLDLLKRVKPKATFFVSGDRHIAEISKLDVKGLKYPLYDFTSSGLTHAWKGTSTEANVLRASKLVKDRNFGLLTIQWRKKSVEVVMQVLGQDGIEFEKLLVKY